MGGRGGLVAGAVAGWVSLCFDIYIYVPIKNIVIYCTCKNNKHTWEPCTDLVHRACFRNLVQADP